MDTSPTALLSRLDGIVASLARRTGTIALIGLGSVGVDRSRLDKHSDLDFFVVVECGYTEALTGNLDWLEEVAPIVFAFENTREGSKVLFEDGIYAEFAVFDLDRLRSASYDGGRTIWQREGFELPEAATHRTNLPVPRPTDWLLGEILTNLYVGLTRLKRGEALSAQRLIQVHAVDRLLDLWPSIEAVTPASCDPFDNTRRAEQRFPRSAPYLARFIQGYSRSTESALATLDFIEERFPVPDVLSQRIRTIADEIITGE